MSDMNYSIVRLAGPTHHQEALADLKPTDDLIAEREPGNRFDSNAIVIKRKEDQAVMGYIPASIAIQMAEIMDETGMIPAVSLDKKYSFQQGSRTFIGVNIRIYPPEG